MSLVDDIFHLFFNSNKKAFISEDVQFLNHYFEWRGKTCFKPKVYTNLVIITALIIIVIIGLFLHNPFTCLTLTLPFIFSCFYFAFIYILKRFERYKLSRLIRLLIDHIFKDYSLLKKLLYAAQEILAIEAKLSTNQSHDFKILSSTYFITVEMFRILRALTIETFQFSNNSTKINDKNRYLAFLPIEIFEELLNQSNPNVYQLQSMINTIRLQQSEYLRSLFCSGCSDVVKNDQKLVTLINNNIKMFLRQIQPYSSQLDQLYTYYSSFWLKDDDKVKVSINHKNFQIISMIRLIKKNIKAALLILEQVEDDVFLMDDSKLLENFKSVENELKNGLKYLLILSNTKNKKDKSQFILSTLPSKPDSLQQTQETIEDEEEIKDEVFELNLKDSETFITNKNNEVEMDEMNDQERLEISESLYNELQIALIPKAMELRKREAKVLGIQPEDIPLQIGKNKFRDKKNIRKKKNDQVELNFLNEEFENNCNLNLASILAKKVCQKSKDLGLFANVENFGDNIEENVDNVDSDNVDN